MGYWIADHIIAACTLSHRHRCRLRSSESYWVRGLIAAAGEPRIRGDVDDLCDSLGYAVATPLTMRGRDVGHLAVGEFPADLVHPLEGELSRDPRFVPKLLFSISGLKISFTLSAIFVRLRG